MGASKKKTSPAGNVIETYKMIAQQVLRFDSAEIPQRIADCIEAAKQHLTISNLYVPPDHVGIYASWDNIYGHTGITFWVYDLPKAREIAQAMLITFDEVLPSLQNQNYDPASTNTLGNISEYTCSKHGFGIPAAWSRQNNDILDHINWYMETFRLNLPFQASQRYIDLQRRVDGSTVERALNIYVRVRDSNFSPDEVVIDVHSMGVDGHNPQLYDKGKVTGVDFCVQAYLLTQVPTADALFHACREVERKDLKEITFACLGATHRSCGCAVLLSILVYPNASIILTTPRTNRSARLRGMIELFS